MLPIRDNVPSRHVPIAMWGLLALNVVVFLYQIYLPERQLERAIYLFGIVPRRFTHPGWAQNVGLPVDYVWPFLTFMFLHGGWMHIISNMWTLWIFGDNVEDRMGPVRFLLFYLICGVASGFVQLITNPSSPIPAIGASGAIAGVLAAYLFLFPLARIVCMIPIIIIPVFFEIYAIFFILIWFAIQVWSSVASWADPSHGGGIAWWAHIGGFVAGALLYRRFLPARRAAVPRAVFLDEYGAARSRRDE